MSETTIESLQGRTLFITGASRGIGKAIALRAARDGANVVVAAKTVEPHPKLPGTIHSAAREIEQAGGRALAVQVDVRDEGSIESAVSEAREAFGGIDIVINNASAIQLTDTAQTEMKRFDLMHQVNVRGTFAVTRACLGSLRASDHAHVLVMSPPLNMEPRWFGPHLAYTMSKYGMSMCVLGWAEEFKGVPIGVNALWPRTAIATAAMRIFGAGQEDIASGCRTPEIVADAAYAIMTRRPGACTGNFFIDDEVLESEGITDLDRYAVNPNRDLIPDFFL